MNIKQQDWISQKNQTIPFHVKHIGENLLTFYLFCVSFIALCYMWSEFIKTFCFVFITPPDLVLYRISLCYKVLLGTGLGLFFIVFYFLFSTIKNHHDH
ncbi:MAG: hypothetical protein JW774_11585 [Candidatus Aureabacteria bacterium]|nr:hypothetical protein [Candidatus Auribacterota bacterium]